MSESDVRFQLPKAEGGGVRRGWMVERGHMSHKPNKPGETTKNVQSDPPKKGSEVCAATQPQVELSNKDSRNHIRRLQTGSFVDARRRIPPRSVLACPGHLTALLGTSGQGRLLSWARSSGCAPQTAPWSVRPLV
jgi:hypothetical protein